MVYSVSTRTGIASGTKKKWLAACPLLGCVPSPKPPFPSWISQAIKPAKLHQLAILGYAVAHEFPWFPFLSTLGQHPEAETRRLTRMNDGFLMEISNLVISVDMKMMKVKMKMKMMMMMMMLIVSIIIFFVFFDYYYSIIIISSSSSSGSSSSTW